MNERVTEQIVRSHLDRSAEEAAGVRYWEQTPDNVRIGKLLRRASKSGAGVGKPEFIVSFDDYQDFLIVMECKANLAKHKSADGKSKPKDFAVDGVRHYAKHLSREFNVLAIAVSGTKKSNLRVSHFLRFKGDYEDESADNLLGRRLRKLGDYTNFYRNHDKLLNQNLNELLLFTQELNEKLHGLRIKGSDRSLLISAILTALEEDGFLNSYRKITKPTLLLKNIRSAMLESMDTSGIQAPIIQSVKSSYSFMDVPGKLGQGRVLSDLVGDIDDRVNNFKKTHEYYDFLGQFYIEFLRYSNSDKSLGIVLTPPHITDLAARLAKVGASDILYDNCAGTGGFLISGMKEMIRDAQGDERMIKQIKDKGIVGVEDQPDIATLLYSNMFIHGDGKSNVFQGDCFDEELSSQIKTDYKPSVGFLNPPFKVAASDAEEMEFVLNNMATLRIGGRCVALLPMQCALSQRGVRQSLKQRILDEHTLEAVLSLPDDIFHKSKVGAVTCLMVFTAGKSHPKGKKTWFGYCKDDGFVKRKPQGRVDYYNRWQGIRDGWVQDFHNRTVRPGFSVMKEVSAQDEWCAEAFIETDYAKLTESDFAEALKKFTAYRFLSEG
ncbi:MAG: N-6 DNA methylase [Deltaproteobacteria bacterium]|nr:N-6 DNA methylase [Deltaproteobacteria bacterium]